MKNEKMKKMKRVNMYAVIREMREQVKDDKTVNLPNKSLLTAGYVTEWALRQATEKTI